MPNPTITLYVDIISPFAYIAFHVLQASAHVRITSSTDLTHNLQNSPAFAKVDITYVPILLGGLMQACNNSPPINIKSLSNLSFFSLISCN
jgi:2-hydroxychromene-2-carboxylate isomerase